MDNAYLQPNCEAVDSSVIHSLLINLGVMPNYRGFSQSTYAILLAVEDPQRLELVTKMLFPEVARCYHTTWTSVERNIRTVAGIAWKNNQEFLSRLSNCPLTVQPTSSQFISIITSYFLNTQLRS